MTYLLDDSGQVLRFANGAGIADAQSRRWLRDIRLAVGVGMFGRAVSERRVLSTGDYERTGRSPAEGALIRLRSGCARYRQRSLVTHPGGLGVFADMLDAFGPADIALPGVTDHAATAIANRRLIADLDRPGRPLPVGPMPSGPREIAAGSPPSSPVSCSSWWSIGGPPARRRRPVDLSTLSGGLYQLRWIPVAPAPGRSGVSQRSGRRSAAGQSSGGGRLDR
jgi:hypothetical protein